MITEQTTLEDQAKHWTKSGATLTSNSPNILVPSGTSAVSGSIS